MKIIQKFFVGLFIATFLFVSCDKDEQIEKKVEEKKNFLKIGEIEYGLKGAILEAHGQGNINDTLPQYEGNNVELYLYSGDVKAEIIEDQIVVGGTIGVMLYADMFSLANDLASGTYSYDGASPYSSGTFANSDYGFEDVPDEYTELINATVFTVKQDSGQHEITIAGVDEKGNAISGYFKGKIDIYDDDELFGNHNY